MSRARSSSRPAEPSQRNRLIGKVHVLKKDLALADDTYRDIIERVNGHRSAADCTDQQLVALVQELERLGTADKPRHDGRPVADAPMAKRARALWLNLWNLDELDDGSERALASFVKRQTGRDDMRFCNAQQLAMVIEALKDMCQRAGLAELQPGRDSLLPLRALVRLQWARLHEAGWSKVAGDFGLASYAHATWCTPNSRSIDQCEAGHLIKLAGKLGYHLRQQQLGRRRIPPA